MFILNGLRFSRGLFGCGWEICTATISVMADIVLYIWFISSGIGPASIGVVSGSESDDIGCGTLFFCVMAKIVENNCPMSSALGVVKIGFVITVLVDVDAIFLFFLVMVG